MITSPSEVMLTMHWMRWLASPPQPWRMPLAIASCSASSTAISCSSGHFFCVSIALTPSITAGMAAGSAGMVIVNSQVEQ